MSPLISVIVPVYNVEKYLKKCIDSIINQTYSKLEIILVDDGSTDNCPEICDEYSKRDERIIVLHKKNGGLSDSRNVGIDKANGEYLCFVDSDDYIALDMIEKLYIALYENAADLSICNFKYVSEDGSRKFNNANLPIHDEVLSGKDILLNKLFENKSWYWVVAWNKLYKRNLFQEVRYPVGKIHEDEFVIHKLLSNCRKVACISEMLYFYMQRNGSIMGEVRNNPNKIDKIEAMFSRAVFFTQNETLKAKAIDVLSSSIIKYSEINAESVLSKSKKSRKRLQCLYRETYKAVANLNLSVSSKQIIKFKLYYISLYWFCRIFKYMSLFQYAIKLIKYHFNIRNKDYALIDTPQHGNLGDHAIVLAQDQLLKDLNTKYYELPAGQIDGREHWFAQMTPRNKTVLVHGGGFLGCLWTIEEFRFRRILQAFHNHKIIVFPQTVTFDLSNEDGQRFFEESKQIYSSHPDLILFVRDKNSYDFMQKYMPDIKAILVPDIVTMLRIQKLDYERKGILMCMRSDLEKNITNEEYDYIYSCISRKFLNEEILNTDTVIDHGISIIDRQTEVDKKLNQFAQSKLVITDRLHGMVFAAITGTPCIALGNSNGKVKGVYEWIKSNSYIHYLDNINKIENVLDKINLDKHYNYNYNEVEKNFIQLLDLFGKD